MAARGVHFALTAEEASRLMDTPDSDDEKIQAFVGEIEERWDKEWTQETDKAWDAIHRCLTDGKLEWGDTPFHMCILPHDNICDDEDYIVCFASAEDVKEVWVAIGGIDRDEMRRRYDTLDPDEYDGELSEDDFEYTWNWFEPLRAFFRKAAEHDRAVIFTVAS